MEKSLEFSKSSGRMGKYSDFGYKKVAQEKLVMWIFCILTVVVVAQIYKCDKNCRELNTQIGTHMSACKTDEIWISSVNYVNVSFLTVILYYCYATVMLCFWGKLSERTMESLYFAQLHVNLYLSQKGLKNKKCYGKKKKRILE